MNIQGLQKMTLLDFPGKVACTVFLAGCDFRCPFCHNADLLTTDAPTIMDDGELLSFLQKRQGLLDGVAFTGGEPLLRRELPELMKKIRELGFAVKLDTNGNHPDALRKVLEQGLVDYVAMDVKNSPERYAETIGLPSFDTAKVSESIAILRDTAPDYEFRTTVVDELHDEMSFTQIGQWIRGAKQYFLQSFTDRESVLQSGLHAPSREKLEAYAKAVSPYVLSVSLRGV